MSFGATREQSGRAGNVGRHQGNAAGQRVERNEGAELTFTEIVDDQVRGRDVVELLPQTRDSRPEEVDHEERGSHRPQDVADKRDAVTVIKPHRARDGKCRVEAAGHAEIQDQKAEPWTDLEVVVHRHAPASGPLSGPDPQDQGGVGDDDDERVVPGFHGYDLPASSSSRSTLSPIRQQPVCQAMPHPVHQA